MFRYLARLHEPSPPWRRLPSLWFLWPELASPFFIWTLRKRCMARRGERCSEQRFGSSLGFSASVRSTSRLSANSVQVPAELSLGCAGYSRLRSALASPQFWRLLRSDLNRRRSTCRTDE